LDEDEIYQIVKSINPSGTYEYPEHEYKYQQVRLKVATARCARISYMTFDGEIDYKKDIGMHDALAAAGHVSPFEHCARAMSLEEYNGNFLSSPDPDGPGFIEVDRGISGNFRGFVQYRKTLQGENRYDSRLIRK
jgi:hypothetical protein